ncbi:MAG: isopentenyl phosphate kinase [Candidatus Micrarchaeaceae archaeon]|nr:isopentenyl phosphate kinase [Candidatus Marsarchaeota archaeon]
MMILKIGGSAFSDKRTGKSFVSLVARNVAKELPKGEKVLIVQGAGFIGHSIALKYGLSKLSNNQNHWALLRYRVEQVSNQIAKALIDNGISPFVMSAQQLFEIKSGRVLVKNLGIVKAYMDNGFIPIIHSDAPLDDRRGISVLSGDNMAAILANRLNASKLVFGTDTDGLIGSSGERIRRISKTNLNKVGIIKREGTIDVSGGMGRKLAQVASTKRGIAVYIIDLRRPGELKKALSRKGAGTLIY